MSIANILGMTLKLDCRHFYGDRPCRFNKESGQTCPDCGHYAVARTRVLIIKLAALGDVLRTTAILPALKRQHPESHVVWLTLQSAADLLKGNPLIDEVWTIEEDASTRLPVEHFDLILNPDADKRTAALATQAHAPEKRGLILDPRGFVLPAQPESVTWLEMGAFDQKKQANQRSYQELICEMLKLPYQRDPLSLKLRDAEREKARDFLAYQGWLAGEQIIGLNVGGGGRWKKKRWKERHFETFIDMALSQAGTKVLLIGGKEEAEFLTRLKARSGAGVLSSGPDRKLRETAALIGECQVMVTGDTLAFHMASALSVPTVVLLGPTSAAELELYDRGEKAVSPIGCVGCYLTDCDLDPDCMDLIDPRQIHQLTARWLQK
jgi:heptosyltransferase-2